MQKAVFIGADPQVAEIVRLGICLRWPDVTPLIATTGTGGLELVREETPDLVLLRPDFPDKTLSEVIRELREFSDVPLVVLNHQTNDLEPVTALEAGADEYIQLPCELSELTFKVWSLMRRTGSRKSGKADEPLIEGDLKVDPSTHEVYLRDRKLSLTPAEFQLTLLLVKNSGAVVRKAEIEKELSKAGLGATGSVKQHIMRLRRKFHDDAKDPIWFANVPGVGYRFIGGQTSGEGSKTRLKSRNGLRKAA
ncbi:MAG: response regulator transcription factor [Chloroflexi bacterium]|nr:response regulator transcription factor [Chloroflexota bacterium]